VDEKVDGLVREKLVRKRADGVGCSDLGLGIFTSLIVLIIDYLKTVCAYMEYH
jgi:hypothetical protein